MGDNADKLRTDPVWQLRLWLKCQFFCPHKTMPGNMLRVSVFSATLSDANYTPGNPVGSTPGFQLCPQIIYDQFKDGGFKGDPLV